MGGYNGVEESIDGGKGSGVGAYIVLYVYLVSSYCPSDPPLPQSVHLIPLLFHYSLKIGGCLGGADDRKEAFEGCLLYTSPSPRDRTRSRMPSSA